MTDPLEIHARALRRYRRRHPAKDYDPAPAYLAACVASLVLAAWVSAFT